jgi:hypothetical protein
MELKQVFFTAGTPGSAVLFCCEGIKLCGRLFDEPVDFDGLQNGDNLTFSESALTHSALHKGNFQYVGRSLKANERIKSNPSS